MKLYQWPLSITTACLTALLLISSAAALSVNREPDFIAPPDALLENPAALEDDLEDFYDDVQCWKDNQASGDMYRIDHPYLVLVLNGTDGSNFVWIEKTAGWHGPPLLPDLQIDHAVICAESRYVSGKTPRWTGKYVYTLLGNYPCNLISEEPSIPARFKNTEYTGPLCALPGRSHQWNGEWLKSREFDYGHYLKGGRHYDTRW